MHLQAADIQPWMLGIRRHLHQWPETMYNEHNTSAYLCQQLDSLGIPYQYALDLSLWLVTNTLAAEQIDTSARFFVYLCSETGRGKQCVSPVAYVHMSIAHCLPAEDTSGWQLSSPEYGVASECHGFPTLQHSLCNQTGTIEEALLLCGAGTAASDYENSCDWF